jgi:hypothetical protein
VSVQQTEQPSPTQAEALTPHQRIARALTNGSGISCVIQKKDSMDTITFEGKGTKSRAYGTALSGGKGTGYLVNDGEYAYIWSEPEKKGVKISMKAASSMQQYQDFSSEATQKKYEDQGYTYECNEASIPDSSFVVPKSVVFSDLSTMMDSMKQYQGNN